MGEPQAQRWGVVLKGQYCYSYPMGDHIGSDCFGYHENCACTAAKTWSLGGADLVLIITCIPFECFCKIVFTLSVYSFSIHGRYKVIKLNAVVKVQLRAAFTSVFRYMVSL